MLSALSLAELTAAHFGGGGLLHKKTAQLPGGDGERPKSRRELIEELVAKSKQDKVRCLHRGRGALPRETHPQMLSPLFPCTLPGCVLLSVNVEKHPFSIGVFETLSSVHL